MAKCNKKWKTLAGFGDWKNGIPKGEVGLIMGCGGRQKNGMYPRLTKQIIVPKNIQKSSNFSKFELTNKEISKFKNKKFYP